MFLSTSYCAILLSCRPPPTRLAVPLRRTPSASPSWVRCTQAHRPELADLVASADLDLDFPGLWLRPQASFRSLNPAWLEPRLLSAAVEGGLRVEWIHVLSGERGREV